ncbi:MAG: helix-turn-helix transcriptional regulator [Rhodoblastus sp.]
MDNSSGARRLAVFVRDRLHEVLATPEDRRRIAHETGIPEPTLKDYGSGRTTPNVDRFMLIACAVGHPPSWFFGEATGANAHPGVVMVPVVDVRASAGPGVAAEVVNALAPIPFPAEFARRIGYPASRLECLRASGDSMAPTIGHGAILIIDRNATRLSSWKKPSRKAVQRADPPDDIFVFYLGADLRLKRLREIGDGFLAVVSDNVAAYPPEIVKPGRDAALRIVGKVVWWDNRL